MPSYRRRTPETEPLYQVMVGHLETFLERTRSSDRQLPRYVEKELRAYLECGILVCGFLRARCEDCGESRIVAFSCTKRGFCPSCTGRRMADTAARLTDEVLPKVPVRQWVLSLPYEGARCGSVAFVQRFGSALNVNPHFHVIVPDGVFVEGPDGDPVFVAAPPLTDKDVQRIAETTAARIVRLLQQRGLLEPDSVDPLWQNEPLLASLTAASVQGTVVTGERAGQRIRRRLVDPQEGIQGGPLCFSSCGFSLHAGPRIVADERSRLERLCRYACPE